MKETWNLENTVTLAAEIDACIRVLPAQNSSHIGAVRREISKRLANAPADFMLSLATTLLQTYGYRGTSSIAYELVRYHKQTFASLDAAQIKALGMYLLPIGSGWPLRR